MYLHLKQPKQAAIRTPAAASMAQMIGTPVFTKVTCSPASVGPLEVAVHVW